MNDTSLSNAFIDSSQSIITFATDFNKATQENDPHAQREAILNLGKDILENSKNIYEAMEGPLSPSQVSAIKNSGRGLNLLSYGNDMYHSYQNNDDEVTFVKKGLSGYAGIYGGDKVADAVAKAFDKLGVAEVLGLNENRGIKDDVEYLGHLDGEDAAELMSPAIIKTIDNINGLSTKVNQMYNWKKRDWEAWMNGHGLNRDGEYYNYDPIVLDLDGDGIEIIDVNNDRNIYFDHNNDGIKNKTSWVDSDDGFLVMDRNNDGIINNGTELFGNSTEMNDGTFSQNGFIALAELDSDKNGIINNLDSKYKDLKIWRDINSDGVSQSKELFSLEQLGIAEIDLSYDQKDTKLIGDNIEAQTSHYVDSEGNHRTISDLNFSFNTFNRQFSDHLALTDEQSHQLNIGGSGTVRDLREAATLSSELNAIIEEFKQAKTKEEQFSVIPSLVLAWAKTSLVYSENIDLLPAFKKTGDDGTKIVGQKSPEDLTGSDEINYITSQLADKIAILDVFSGMGGSIYYTNKKDLEQIQLTIINQYTTLCESIYRSLIIDTRLAPYYDLLQFDSSYHIDFAPMIALFESNFAQDPMNTFIDLGELLSFETRSEKSSSLCALFEKYLKYAVDNSYFSIWTEKLGTTALTHLGYIAGSANAEKINGSAFVDYIYSDAGEDEIYAAAGDDIIWGGER